MAILPRPHVNFMQYAGFQVTLLDTLLPNCKVSAAESQKVRNARRRRHKDTLAPHRIGTSKM
jgi:hypothetical protein